MNETPNEYHECVNFRWWLDSKGIKYSYLAQDTFTKSIRVLQKNKALGVHAGVPDYIVILPECKGLLFIEMKRIKGGRVSEFQQEWINELNTLTGVEAKVCYGAEEAIKYVESFLINEQVI